MRYYILATLGTSPAVLAELCHALVAGEGADVVGLEVWTTGGDGERTGQAVLEAFVRAGRWDELVAALGARGDRVPRARLGVPGDRDEVGRRVDAGERPWRVELFRDDDGRPLADIRSASDAQAMDAQLFRRVRELQALLPPDVALVGSLAGGRKTMSAGLQNAFTLLGGPGDRLVHVLLHPELEACRDLRDYVAPTAAWAERTGVPVGEQVVLHDVRFPLLRQLLREASLDKGPTIEGMLAERDYGELTHKLRTVAATPREAVRGELRLDRYLKKWWLTVRAGDVEVHRVELDWMKGQCYLAVAAAPDGGEPEELYDWLVENGGDIDERTRGDAGPRNDTDVRKHWSKQRERLRAALVDLRVVGLADFLLHTTKGGGTSRDHIPAAREGRLRFDRADLVL